MPDLPHFALPFRFENARAVVLEQDTTDEILACVLAIVLCPLGFRVELPAFGVPDPTFSEGRVNPMTLDVALAEWEPRAPHLSEAWIDEADPLVAHVLTRVGAISED